MFKRLRWLILGGVFGVGGSVWVRRRARDLAERYAPVRGTATVVGTARAVRPSRAFASFSGTARRLSRDLREAWMDGQREMRDTETELRKERVRLLDGN